ncbi:hypothetical protein KP509_14G053300 [Ceratopteris richardii]|uniref:Pectate lyase n=1 Tax=Ceratopteris richardii TaxID=49495 RepID=A0A8T2T7X4_CERRI|nr:hypothetical protein KP509_14G053300 [Ceratopteris richardii]
MDFMIFALAAQALLMGTKVSVSSFDIPWNSGMNRTSSTTYDGAVAASAFEPYFNSIDACWRAAGDWEENRMKLADCSIGFGRETTGGKGGEYYVVTDEADDAENPAPGTLRYGVIQMRPLWIFFARDMIIILQNELIFTSDKTVDGRGAQVHIAYGPCFTIQNVENVIVHGLHIHNCRPGYAGRVRSSTDHIGHRAGSDGDGISVFGSRNIWIDHNYLASCTDGLVDVIHASTAITISNNYFCNHNKVMLLGHNDRYSADKAMRVTVAFNRFGPGLNQRMPRCRFGYFHVVNNEYEGWGEYAIGGSASPTIISEGNKFVASSSEKQVTKRDCTTCAWEGWTWASIDDTFSDGAYFVESGPTLNNRNRNNPLSLNTFNPSMTAAAGVLACSKGEPC